jgi:hypothetical protein
MPITPFLSGNRVDPETRRIVGLAFEMIRGALRIVDADDDAYQSIANKIIERAKAGERDPNILCEQTLHDIRTPPAAGTAEVRADIDRLRKRGVVWPQWRVVRFLALRGFYGAIWQSAYPTLRATVTV